MKITILPLKTFTPFFLAAPSIWLEVEPPPPQLPSRKGWVHTMMFSHRVSYYFSLFFQPVSLVISSQYFGHFLAMWISLPKIFLPSFRSITSPTGFLAIWTIIPLLPWFTSLPLAIFPLFGHYFDHLVCLPHTSLPTFRFIDSFRCFSTFQSILLLLSTFVFLSLANNFSYLAHFLSLFIQSISWSLFQSCGLVISSVTTTFCFCCLPYWLYCHFLFIQVYPFFLHSRPLPWKFFALLGIFFQPLLQLFGQSPSNVSPKVFQPFSEFCLCRRPNEQKSCVNHWIRLRKLD